MTAMLGAGASITYQYSTPSAVVGGAKPVLGLAAFTPLAEPAPTPSLFFAGFVSRPDVVAAGLLAVARVAASRYYTPMATIIAKILAADPVVTCDGERLRFESFSQCCSVHARLDVDPGGLDGAFATIGTTNVDVNPPLRDALARINPSDPLRLRVGDDELAVDTLDGTVIERQVPLPKRWLKGFGETQVEQSRMKWQLDLSAQGARRLLQSLPIDNRRAIWLEAAPNGHARIGARPSAEAVGILGVDRLEAIQPLLRFTRRLSVHSTFDDRGVPTSAAWVIEMDRARLTLTLSPEPSAGFSGGGSLLAALADPSAGEVADRIAVDVATQPFTTSIDLAAAHDLLPVQAQAGLDVLAASGRLGFDLVEEGFYSRVLPFGDELLHELNPRLRSSRDLISNESVRLDESGLRATVTSGDHHHLVVLSTDSVVGATCTCPWNAKHRGTRGPCKHVLAAVMARRGRRP